MGGSDRALMLGLPPLAVLAAFALPTLQRGTAAAIDWFSVCFFTIFATAIWVVYLSMQTGVPPQPAANVAKLAPGYLRGFSLWALLPALAATLAWLWLVKWRTGRSRHPLWKSLVLPAGGVALCWLLAMTLLLPPLDQARSYRSMIQRVERYVPRGSCLAAPGVSRAQVMALDYLGGFRVDAVTSAAETDCAYLLQMETRLSAVAPASTWKLLARERRTANDPETVAIYRRRGIAGG
jgi:4-amino-4-deoxy-L-arabinose transferase-like glycosyltransferase